MILLKTLKLNNFLSHENTEINFNENEKLVIDGRSGSGKSSIADSIIWALYGKGRTDNRGLVRRGCKSASVVLKLTDGKSEYNITRTVSSTGKNSLIVTQNRGTDGNFLAVETTGLKDTQSWIETTLLKASYELFTNSIAYPQENSNSFVKATAGRRKDLLLEIVQAGSFDDLYEKTKDQLNRESSDSLELRVKKEGLERTIRDNSIENGLEDKITSLIEITQKEILEQEAEERLVSLEMDTLKQEEQRLVEKKERRTNAKSELTVVETRSKRNESSIELFNQMALNIEQARKDLATIQVLEMNIVGAEKDIRDNVDKQSKINAHMANRPLVINYDLDIDRLNKQLIPLIKDTHKCPAGDQCPFIVPIQGQISFLSEQINIKEAAKLKEKIVYEKWETDFTFLCQPEDLTILYEKVDKMKENLKKLSKSKEFIASYETSQKQIEDVKLENGELAKRIYTLTEEITKLDKDISELEETVKTLKNSDKHIHLLWIKNNLVLLRSHKDDYVGQQATLKRQKETIVAAENEIKTIEKKFETVIKRIDDLTLLKEAFSPRGIKAVVIDYLVPQLEERINGILGKMSDFRIRLDTQKATADEEGTKEGMFITVINDRGEELSFDSYSGGEKVKITISISEALASLMNHVGFRIMDENIVSLDKESTEAFVAILCHLQKKFNQLLLISHLQEVKDTVENRLTIIKINGISKIV